MREYVWHMGEAVYKNKNDLKQSFRWFGAALPVLFGSVNEKRLDNYIKEMGYNVKTGVFGADMKVNLINDGPFTMVIDSEELL